MSPVIPLTIALLAISSAAPLIVFAAAPALAIAFWRVALAVGVIVPVSFARRRAELAGLLRRGQRRTGLWSVLAGVALAAHFATWVPSAKLTTVANATALLAVQPVWQGLIAVGQGRRLRPAVWVGIGVAVAGVALATGVDFAVSRDAVVGDLLAVAGGVAAAIYTGLGERARAVISTTGYTAICYTACGLLLGALCLLLGVPLTGFDTQTWLAIVALAVGAQLLGHSLVNYALHRVSATTISVLLLLEVPGAALVAWVWLGQVPGLAALPGLVLIVLGVLIVLRDSARAPATPQLA